MASEDPEQRIAELERQLAEQKRIAELERQLAEAKAAAGQYPATAQASFSISDAQPAGGPADADRARQFAESLWEGLRTGTAVGPGGPAAPEMAAHREAFLQAAAQAGLSQEQIDDIFKHGKATFRVGHSVVYSGQGAAAPAYSQVSGFGAGAGPQPFGQQVGSRRQASQRRRRPWGTRGWPDRIGMIIGAFGICIGAAASLTALMPSSAVWTSPFVCDSGYQLAYNVKNYSYKPGQSGSSVSFECVGATDAYEPSWLAIDALHTALVTLALGAVVAVGFVIWRAIFRDR
jgi:hypothetical protein